ncbi:hypothetical protein [Tissierella praeacuta]|uniref:hypothetical protein n=1 Tax=Tissierella praeacuta TaxID=43131 RepID=UPI003340E6B5
MEIKRVRLITNDDYRDLIRFIEGIEMALKNNQTDLALSGLYFMKGSLKNKIEEEI